MAVVGATATGKSDLALDLAQELGGEVVNADAMQLYRGMDIGTNKLPVEQRRGIPHHLLDVLEVTDEATLADYQSRVEATILDVLGRGLVPILAGGSGLYVRAAPGPPRDPTDGSRRAGPARGAGRGRRGSDALRHRLRELDPAAADAIEPNNIRRIIRALEVVEITGRPFSATAPTKRYRRPSLVIGLRDDWAALTQRIERRARGMWEDGLLDEVVRLDAAGLRGGRTASRAIGYAQALGEIDGRWGRAEAIDDTARATRRYARRQESWWRPDPRVEWLDAAGAGLREAALELAARPTQWTP
uniref:tRNA (Adenosine(37)-N6)-dimethylallyltransferase MiaA n=1 Tax=Janibacter limosus TaxID=53458 RepID=A0AC61U8H5_9MICO|nr:tRNA (adenosine(37)-N6)-dimethylallyltransferase MiaA [Janibacter limosus]